jgi:hypothetical protein
MAHTDAGAIVVLVTFGNRIRFYRNVGMPAWSLAPQPVQSDVCKTPLLQIGPNRRLSYQPGIFLWFAFVGRYIYYAIFSIFPER